MTFKDHFSASAEAYAFARPRYPAALAEALAALCPARELAWDAGCGSGQLSGVLAGAFARVEATDASVEQVARAEPHPRVTYRAAPAEASGLPDGCADLVVAAQAAHWFDLPRFYAEAERVARPGGVLALVAYGLMRVDGGLIDAAVRRFHDEALRRHWPEDRWKVIDGYRSLPFPDPELPAPSLAMEAAWDLPALLAYVGTWSGLAAAERAGRGDLRETFAAEAAAAWGDPAAVRPVRWPLSFRLGRLGHTAVPARSWAARNAGGETTGC